MNILYNFEEELAKYGLTTESYEQLLMDCSKKVNKVSDLDWGEICSKYNLEFNPDTIRKGTQPPLIGSVFVSEYYKWKEAQNKGNQDDAYMKDLLAMKREAEKEKIKYQTEKLEYSKWLRQEARDELIMEKICDAIKSLKPFYVPEYIEPERSTQAHALIFGDEHYGAEFEIKGLFGDIINSYNPEIFEKRMWVLLNKTIEAINKDDIKELNVFSMGDFGDGCLRVSQLMKLRYGVIEGSVKYAHFISTWLNELSKYVRVKFQMTDGNHTELRMLGQPKGTFVDDNMGKVVSEVIKLSTKDNENFTYIENPTGYIYAQLACHTVLGFHGEKKNMETALKDFSKNYGVPIDYLIAGHLHHTKVEDVGSRSSVINVPSIVGTDPYSMSLNKISDPAAKLLTFDQLDGLVDERTFVLN